MKNALFQVGLWVAVGTLMGCNTPGSDPMDTGTDGTSGSPMESSGSDNTLSGASESGSESGSIGTMESGSETGSTGLADSGDSSTGAEESESGSTGGSAGSMLDDEFDGNTLSSDWTVIFPQLADSISVADGDLVVTAADVAENGWVSGHHAPAVVKEVTGNFAAMVDVSAIASATFGEDGHFNSAGFLIRDPNSSLNNENWMTYNIGSQLADFSREIKKTVNSVSVYFLNEQPTTTEQLLVCRVGQSFYFYNWNEGASQWVRENVYYDTTTAVFDPGTLPEILPEVPVPAPGDFTPLVFTYGNTAQTPAMPDTLQVGLTINSYYAPRDIEGRFHSIRFATEAPSAESDCTAELAP